MKYTSILSLASFLGCSLSAATLTGSFNDYDSESRGDADFDLTALGNVDWAYWNTSSSPASGAPTNSKLSASVIGDMYAVGGGAVRGAGSGARFDFSFTDGTSPTSGSIDDPTGLLNNTFAVDDGVGLDFVLPEAGVNYEVRVWVAGFNVDEGLFTASIVGASNYSDTSFSDAGLTSKSSAMYVLNVTPDSNGDTLSVAFTLNTSGGSSPHTIIGGASVYAIPEPAAAGLFIGLAGIGCVFLRRRSR